MGAAGEPPPPPESSRQRILARIAREAGVPALVSILAEKLSAGDLQSLMLEVYARRAQARRPSDVLADNLRNRFVRLSMASVRRLLVWETLAWSCHSAEFEAVGLAPVAPLGTVSVLAPLSQDWRISTSRNTEVVSDSTNMLALEASARRKELLRKDSKSSEHIHLAASHRLLRGRRVGEGPGVRQHFRAFALCSAGRDPGGLRFETELACQHIRFFVRALGRHLGPDVPLRVAFQSLEERSRLEPIRSAVMHSLSPTLPRPSLGWEEATPASRAYYRTIRFHIYAQRPSMGEKELVDGGAVDWGQKLVNSGKERMFISGIGTERLTDLLEPGGLPQPPTP
jgi:hypothetical protein